jgi:hypothetical protein
MKSWSGPAAIRVNRLLIEWPKGEPEPTKSFLSALITDIPIKKSMRVAKLRWRIERDCQNLKQALGIGHFEGCSRRGFHHHATLCIAAYAFLLAERQAGQKKLCTNRYWTKCLPYPKASSPGRPRAGSATCPTRSPRCIRIGLGPHRFTPEFFFAGLICRKIAVPPLSRGVNPRSFS